MFPVLPRTFACLLIFGDEAIEREGGDA